MYRICFSFEIVFPRNGLHIISDFSDFNEFCCFRFLAMQKLAEEKKAEALKQMNSMPQVELDLKQRHDGYHCRDGRGLPSQNSMSRQHPKQVGNKEVFFRHFSCYFEWIFQL